MLNTYEAQTKRKLEYLKNKKGVLEAMTNIYQNANEEMNNMNESVDADLFLEHFMENKLPVNTLEELQYMENILNEEYSRAYITEKLYRIGGRNASDCTRLILKRLISDQLATQFSWLGLKKKLKFSVLKLANVILKAISMHNFSDTEHQMIDVIKRWLAHAPERVSRVEKKNE